MSVPPNPGFGQSGTTSTGRRACCMSIARATGSAVSREEAPARTASSLRRRIGPRLVAHDENYTNDPYTMAHARDFLDCVKSRRARSPTSRRSASTPLSLPARTARGERGESVHVERNTGRAGVTHDTLGESGHRVKHAVDAASCAQSTCASRVAAAGRRPRGRRRVPAHCSVHVTANLLNTTGSRGTPTLE